MLWYADYFMRSLVYISVFILHVQHVGGNINSEIGKIKNKIWRSKIPSNGKSTYRQVSGILALQHTNGAFVDIDYNSSQIRGSTPFTAHCSRLNVLSQSYHINETDNEWFQDQNLKVKIEKGYNYVTYDAPQNEDSNWWGHQIGVPLKMYPGLFLMANMIDRTLVVATLDRYWKDTDVWDPSDTGGRNAGSNFAFRAYLGIMESLIRGKDEFVSRHTSVMTGVDRELIDREGYGEEGVQPDNCLHQHNVGRTHTIGAYTNTTRHLIYNGEYNGLLVKMSELANYFLATSFQLPGVAQDTLVEAMLDCHQWFVWNTAFEPTTCGRKITRNAVVSLWSARTAKYAAEKLLVLNKRRPELQRFITRYGKPKPDVGTELIGNKGLYNSDMMVHQRGKFMASVRMLSDRTIRPETWAHTSATPKGYYMGDGCFTVMNHGYEFGVKGIEIYQLYDWELIPGVTVEYSGKVPEYSTGGGGNLPHATGTSWFVGSVSTGVYGAASMDYERLTTNITAKKSWFFFDDEIVAMMADLDASDTAGSNEVVTTLNQIHQSGMVTVKDGLDIKTEFESGSKTFEKPKWLHHDDTAYIFLDGMSTVTVSAETRTTIINGKNETANVFTAHQNHGIQPVGHRFTYIIKPATESPDDIDQYIINKSIVVVANNKYIQAVHQKQLRLSGIIFRKAGSVDLPTGTHVAVDKECFVMIDEKGAGTEVAVSHPDPEGATVKITVNQQLSGDGAYHDESLGRTTLTYTLPEGRLAGKSVVKTFS